MLHIRAGIKMAQTVLEHLRFLFSALGRAESFSYVYMSICERVASFGDVHL